MRSSCQPGSKPENETVRCTNELEEASSSCHLECWSEGRVSRARCCLKSFPGNSPDHVAGVRPGSWGPAVGVRPKVLAKGSFGLPRAMTSGSCFLSPSWALALVSASGIWAQALSWHTAGAHKILKVLWLFRPALQSKTFSPPPHLFSLSYN